MQPLLKKKKNTEEEVDKEGEEVTVSLASAKED